MFLKLNHNLVTRMDSPGIADILGTIIYAIVIILLAAAQAIAIVVIAYGFIATAVCVHMSVG
jgi:hypothetical protein